MIQRSILRDGVCSSFPLGIQPICCALGCLVVENRILSVMGNTQISYLPTVGMMWLSISVLFRAYWSTLWTSKYISQTQNGLQNQCGGMSVALVHYFGSILTSPMGS